jgi:hypothetical protein
MLERRSGLPNFVTITNIGLRVSRYDLEFRLMGGGASWSLIQSKTWDP